MNHSMYSADQMTHLKIVAIALVTAIGVAGFAITTRIKTGDGYIQTAHLIKANVIKAKNLSHDRTFALALTAP